MVVATVLLYAFCVISAVVGIGLGLNLLHDTPSREHWFHDFDLRLYNGKHTVIVDPIPSIVWETPEGVDQEAYHPVHTEIRVPTKLGYRVELMGQ